MSKTKGTAKLNVSKCAAGAEPCALSLKLVLHCTKTDETVNERIVFNTVPSTILDVKKQVENTSSIPVCVQVISYEGHTVHNHVELSSLRVRDGDTFHLKYLAKGHCTEINNTITLMHFLAATLKDAFPSVEEGMDIDLSELLSRLIGNKMIEDLAFKYFFPWLEPVNYANKLHFVYNNGVDTVMEVYKALLQRPWCECIVELKYIEYGILRVLWNLTETFPLRRLVIQNRGIGLIIQSMLRTRLDEGSRMEDMEPNNTTMEKTLLLETIVAGLGTLCNLSELPESHMEIASNDDALHQLTCISLIPSVRIVSAQLVATLFLCLSYTPNTHKQISNPVYIRRLLYAYKIPRQSDSDNLEEALLLLRYFTMVFLAQVSMVSPQYIPQEYQKQIINEMDSLLQATDYETIMQYEVKHWYVWATFLPYVKLAYVPNTQTEGPLQKLQLLSLEVIIFALQNMLGRENHREFLKKEGLLDFVTCMPQYVPPSLKSRATKLVQMVASSPDVPEGPPKLLNLVKARLAKMNFGLEKVLSVSVSEIITCTENVYM